jgi:hypothetical protein
MLSENSTYSDISQSLKLTNETIARIHAEMAFHPGNFKLLLSKIKPWKRKQLLKEIVTTIGNSTLMIAAKHAGGRI